MTTPKPPFNGDTDALGVTQSLSVLLQSILASVPDAMIVIDERGSIRAFSRAAEHLFGYSAAEMRGKNVACLMTSKDQPHHDQYIRNYLNTGERQIIGIGRIVEAQLADGRIIPVELKIGEAEFGDEKLFTGYIRDISEQQANAHKMNEMQAELAGFSRLSAVGSMASAMAHELNQPLTAVANYLEAARDLLNTPDPETVEMVQDALNAAATQSIRAGQIVRRLRDYVSRGEVDLRPVSLAEIVEDAVSLAKVGLPGPLAHMRIKIPQDLPDVLGDRLQLRQVLVNLVRNAIEVLAGQTDAYVYIEAETSGTDHVLVTVRDNGPGFPENFKGTPFDAFNSSKPGGMGLGLSICHTIIDAHGGTISLTSEAGEGAAFRFDLRLATRGEPV